MNKWNIIKGLCALFTSAALFVACTDAKHEAPEGETGSQFRVNANGILNDPDLSAEEKSAQLVAAGEQLIMPETFHLANSVFQQALEVDPTNKHAGLYVELLKPSMNLKGFLGRIEPLVQKDEREYSKYKEQLDKKEFFLQGYHNGTVYGPDSHAFAGYEKMWSGSFISVDFLADSDGMAMISTEKDLQDFIRGQVTAFDNLRVYLNQVINNEYEITLAERFAENRVSTRANTCRFTIIGDFDYQIECDHNPEYMKVNVDRGDLEALKGMVTGMQIYHIIGSAYDISEGQKHIMNFRDNIAHMSERNKIETVLNDNENTATLNENQMLGSILNLGKDAMIGARWLRENHVKMCPGQNNGMAFYHRGHHYNQATGNWEPRRVLLRREGQLFDRGICWDEFLPQYDYQELGQIFDTIDKAIVGEEIEIRSWEMANVMDDGGSVSKRNTGQKVSATIKPSVFFANPISDLREVRPSEYNGCGKVKALSDNTIGGVFKNGDANDFLQKVNVLNRDEVHCEEE